VPSQVEAPEKSYQRNGEVQRNEYHNLGRNAIETYDKKAANSRVSSLNNSGVNLANSQEFAQENNGRRNNEVLKKNIGNFYMMEDENR
jgi:hypothetical protein